jgi:hypothetical protein
LTMPLISTAGPVSAGTASAGTVTAGGLLTHEVYGRRCASR